MGKDEDFKFICNKETRKLCESHCCYPGPSRIFHSEIEKIKEYYKKKEFYSSDFDEGIRSFLIKSGCIDTYSIYYSFKRKRDGSCIFLDKDGCSIYPHRPLACKIYPYLSVYFRNGSSLYVVITLSSRECPGIGLGPSIKDSLEEYALEYVLRKIEDTGEENVKRWFNSLIDANIFQIS